TPNCSAEHSGSRMRAHSMVVITGCFVDSHRDELEHDGRSFVVDNEHKNSIFDLVEARRRGEIVHPESFPPDRFNYSGTRRIFRTRGMLKIQDGCDNFCSFCIIPFVRGKAISRSSEEVLGSARQMLSDGYKELVLTGVNMSRYHDDGASFSQLLERLLELDGDYRLRISSIEPDCLDDHFIDLLAHERMTPHLHLCLQSASEKMLLKMRRQYTYAEYRELIGKIRAVRGNFNVTTDLIVGFPGEGDAEFRESLDALREIEFGHVHVFKYSIRRGTRAERMEGHLPERVKTERSETIRRQAGVMKRAYRQKLIGKTQRVLVERVENVGGRFRAGGFGEHYVPVRFSPPEFFVPEAVTGSSLKTGEKIPLPEQPGSFENCYRTVKITGIADGDDPELSAEIIA
ncbi:MAG: MiaB/RimO family radical SAM methylthiotransferase, partial [Salinispira sp.]